MNMIQFLFGETRDAAPRFSPDSDFWYTDANFAGYGLQLSPEAALSVTAVYTCVRILAESVATLPLHLYRQIDEKSKERERTHPLATLLKRPNSWMTKTEFWEYMIAWVGTRGNAFARKIFSNGGDIIQLIPLDTSRMNIEQQADGQLIYFYTLRNGNKAKYSQSDIFHLRGLPYDGIRGMSPLEALQKTLGYQNEITRYGQAFFKNNAQPGGTLVHPGKLSPEARKNLQDSIQQSYTGANVGKTMILEEGLKFEAPKISHADLQFIEIQKLNKSDIYSAFRVPPHLAGDLERATFSNIEQQALEFVQFTLQPWLIRAEEAIWRDLIADDEKNDLFAQFLVMGLLRGDQKARFEAYVQGLNNGFLNADEVRSYENLNPIPDGSGQIFRVPLNLAPSDQEPEDNSSTSDPEDPKGVPSTPGSAEPVANRSRLADLFYDLFSEQYGRLITREEKSTKKTPEWREEHKNFVAQSLQTLVSSFIELYCASDSEKLKTQELRTKIGTFLAEKDSVLSDSYRNLAEARSKPLSAYKIPELWSIMLEEVNATLEK